MGARAGRGGRARLKAAVLKTARVESPREFESPPLRSGIVNLSRYLPLKARIRNERFPLRSRQWSEPPPELESGSSPTAEVDGVSDPKRKHPDPRRLILKDVVTATNARKREEGPPRQRNGSDGKGGAEGCSGQGDERVGRRCRSCGHKHVDDCRMHEGFR